MNRSRKPEHPKSRIARLLARWDAELPPALVQDQARLKSRRRFLSQVTGAAAAGGLLPVFARTKEQPAAGGEAVLKEPWLTLSLVQEHLFPAGEDSPGAKDINAIGYLRTMLAAPGVDPEDRVFILKGVDWLDGVSNERLQKPFKKLDAEQREQVLKRIARSHAGENWLSLLMLYIVEALLADPVYGGNPGGIGWKWLQHQPGFPTPPANKKYWMLG